MQAIILAAGTSSRMRKPKLLLPWRAQTVLTQTIQNVQAVTHEVLVVTGAYAAQTCLIAAECGVPTVQNPDYAVGEMISSLQAGLRVLDKIDGFFVMLGDMPLVQPETMREILEHWNDHKGIVVPTFEGKRGHPVIFSAEFIPQLLALTWEQTPRHVIQANLDKRHLFPVQSKAILIDLDTPDSYARWRPKPTE